MNRHLAAVPDRPGRVVLYVRVSALMGRGGDDFHSPDVQVAAMRRATAGMREVGVIQDLDQTGRHFSRDGIDRIRQMAERGELDALAVYNVSRLGRNVLESLKFLTFLADKGVTIVSASEALDTSTPSGRWMLTTMLGIAEMRSDEIGLEWSAAIAARARAGRHHGKVPLGYLRDYDGRLSPDPQLGPLVAQTFTEYAAGAPVRQLRTRLQLATGTNLAANSMKRMLANLTYRGTVHVRGVTMPDAHPALVDEVTWQRVQDRITADRKVHPKILGARYSLSGLGRCAVCEGNTNIRPQARGPEIYCRGQFERVRACTGCGRMRLAAVEAAVLEHIRGHIALLTGDVGTQSAQLAKAARAGADAAALRRELDATRRAMAKATERWARDQIDDQIYEDTMGSLRNAEQRLTDGLASAQRTADTLPPGQIVALAEKLLELWPDMDGGQRNRALRDVADTVVIRPAEAYREPAYERVTVVWR